MKSSQYNIIYIVADILNPWTLTSHSDIENQLGFSVCANLKKNEARSPVSHSPDPGGWNIKLNK